MILKINQVNFLLIKNFSLGAKEVEYKNKIIIPPTKPKIIIIETQKETCIFKIIHELKIEVKIKIIIINNGWLLIIKEKIINIINKNKIFKQNLVYISKHWLWRQENKTSDKLNNFFLIYKIKVLNKLYLNYE